MERLSGYLVLGGIGGEGRMYFDTPTCISVDVVYDGREYVFYNKGREIFRARTLSEQWWEIEFDSFESKHYYGGYWYFMTEEQVNFIINLFGFGKTKGGVR
jgi:hypothetical protein